MAGGFHKAARLHARDIRKLDLSAANKNSAAIIVRHNVILVNLEPFRALIFRDRCLVVPPAGADEILTLILERLEKSVQSSRGKQKKNKKRDGKTEERKKEEKRKDGGEGN